jgi:signal transduction histidine kinase
MKVRDQLESAVLGISLVGFFISCFVAMCHASHAFAWRAQAFYNARFDYSPTSIFAFWGAWASFVVIYAVLWSKARKRNGDSFSLPKTVTIVALWACLFLAGVFYAAYRYYDLSVIVLSLIACAAFVGSFWAVLRHLHWAGKADALVWPDFFKKFPPRKPIGLIMALIISLIILIVSLVYRNNAFAGFLIFLPSMGIFTALAHFLRRHEAELDRLYKAALEKMLKAERLKIELLTNVSHDIKTPLTSIVTYADLIGKLEIQHPDLKEYAAVLSAKSLRLKALIEDLIEASKANTGNIGMSVEPLDLVELAGQIMGEFVEKLAGARLQLVDKLPKEPVCVKADGRQLWRVLENIFSNALKYSLPGTRIYASVLEREGKIVFLLKNVSKEPLDILPDELTEQFARGDRSRGTEGSGLGLYIAKGLAEGMGGSLSVSITGDLFEAAVSLRKAEAPARKDEAPMPTWRKAAKKHEDALDLVLPVEGYEPRGNG